MTNKSVWVRIPVDIYNRDRAGGHGPAILTDDFGYKGECGIRAARGLKKDRRRKHRREARRIKEEALSAMIADREADILEDRANELFGEYGDADDYEFGMMQMIEHEEYMRELEHEERLDWLYRESFDDEPYLEWDY